MDYLDNRVDDILERFKPIIGIDYPKYRNHVYRVFLNCLLLDNEKSNSGKYAVAAVFHDIGIWTDNTINYLGPSIEQVKIFLTDIDKEEWIEEAVAMIYWHHKINKYKGKFSATVEVFRKADWIDVSLGLLLFGVRRKDIKAHKKTFPNLGFHFFLIKKLCKNFFKHPLHPLPMFKR